MCNLDPMAPPSRKKRQFLLGPGEREGYGEPCDVTSLSLSKSYGEPCDVTSLSLSKSGEGGILQKSRKTREEEEERREESIREESGGAAAGGECRARRRGAAGR